MTGGSVCVTVALSALLFGLVTAAGATPVGLTAPEGKPDAIVDLRTQDGVELVQGEWRYSDARLVEVDFNAAGADLKPSGPPIRTQDVEPKAGAVDVDDSSWEVLDPTALDATEGFDTSVVVDATAPVDLQPGDGARAIEEMEANRVAIEG